MQLAGAVERGAEGVVRAGGADTTRTSLAPLREALQATLADPAYRWSSREDPLGVVRRLWWQVGEWIERLRVDNPLAFRALTWALVAVLVGVLLHAAWVASRTIRSAHAAGVSDGEAPLAPRDAAWYAAEAARHAARGDFVAAMQADFLRLLLELDARHIVRFHPGKTPVEYTAEPTLDSAGRTALTALVLRMYGHAFGDVPLDRPGYEAWRRSAIAEQYGASA